MSSDSIRIVMVDGHRLLLESLSLMLNAQPDIEVVATAVDSDQGFETILEHKPDVALLDIALPGSGTFEIAPKLAQAGVVTKIIHLTGYLSDIFVDQALRSGARGYLLKAEPSHVLIDFIRRVQAGNYCFSKDVEPHVEFSEKEQKYVARTERSICALTPRQLSILHHLAAGATVKEVARALHLSVKSVDSHKYRIMHTLDIHDRVDLARFAIREGLSIP